MLDRQQLDGGEDRAPCEQIEYTSTAELHVLGRTSHPTMRMQLMLDRSRGLCTFRQLQPSGMMARLEGVNAALPLRLPPDVCLSRREQHRPQLEEELKQATERFLCSMGVVKPGTKPARLTTFNSTQQPGTHGGQVTADDGGACSAASGRSLDEDGGSGRRLSLDEDRCKVASLFRPSPKAFNIFADEEDEPAQQRTVLIMQHKVKLRFVPPGIGKLLLGHLTRMHLQSLRDILVRFAVDKHTSGGSTQLG